MQRDDAVLLDIAKAAQSAIDFAAGLDRQAFLADLKTQSAVLHQILILGEATKRLSDGFRNAHPEIPWKLIAGMRDNLIHVYDAVDLDEVWQVIQHDLPDILAQIKPLLPD